MMGKLNRGVCLVFSFLMMQSCNLDIESNVNLQKKDFFFSTEAYFNNEIDRLSSKTGFTKYVDFNGKKEDMQLDTLSLAQEFIPFINSDINKVIWSDQYVCDSILAGQQLIQLNCRCSNPKLKTKKLDVVFVNGKVSSVSIENHMSKMLMKTNEFLEYQKDKYYQISRVQELSTGGLDSTFVKVIF